MPNADIIAVYPGSFDPVTNGHLDVIRRAARLFNRLVVGVGRNPDKRELFTQRERLALLEPHLREFGNVRIESYDGLTIDFVRKIAGRVIVRGIRDIHDLSNELQQANVNMSIGGIDTVYLMTSDQYALTSSTYVKQIFELGGGPERLARLVPKNVVLKLGAKLGRHGARSRKTRGD